MPLFDTHIVVDWSARAVPSPARPSKDAIWIGIARTGSDEPASEYVRTRKAAEARLSELLGEEIAAGRRALVGFDFPFGYPAGVAERVAGRPDALALWDWFEAAVEDDEANANNRFEVAARINALYDGVGPFWGAPGGEDLPGLPAKGKARTGVDHPPERRACDRVAKGAKTVWQIMYSGSVGSQVILGLPAANRLRRALCGAAQVWPFESGLEAPTAPVVLAEIYPSLFAVPSDAKDGVIGDDLQVRMTAAAYRGFDTVGTLRDMFHGPDADAATRERIAREEAWILGLGHPALKGKRRGSATAREIPAFAGMTEGGGEVGAGAAAERRHAREGGDPVKSRDAATVRNSAAAPRPSPRRLAYERDPAAIYAASFATVEAEAELGHLPADLRDVAIRLVHSCGMTDVPNRLAWSDDVAASSRAALARGAPILCDCEMVASGVIRRFLPKAVEVVVTLNDPAVPERAKAIGNTRSAAAVELWEDRLEGAICVFGNAPTALFRLLEMLDDGAPKPAAILGFPVGFVGAAESKAELAARPRGVPFLTLRGRRGGSAMASAAVNALAGGLG